MRLARILLFSLLFVSACNSNQNDKKSLAELRAAPEQVKIAGCLLKLDSELWRDAMPPISRETRPLGGVVKLQTTDGKAFPRNVQVETVFIINGDKVWSAPVKEIRKAKQDSVLEVVVRNGPDWASATMDVAVLLKDEEGEFHLIRAADQAIKQVQ